MDEKNSLESVVGCRFLNAPKVVDDRGTLCIAETSEVIPFDIKRIFWIIGVGKDKIRGGHSHSTCSEAIFPLKGSFDIKVTDGKQTRTVTMDDPSCGILISAGVWCELSNFSADAVCFVAASHHYNSIGYINDFNEYLRQCK
jgi:hypothetical protein